MHGKGNRTGRLPFGKTGSQEIKATTDDNMDRRGLQKCESRHERDFSLLNFQF
jgi:hypothetical protein